MCITCWREQYGSPKIFNSNVARLIIAVDSVYRYNAVGGCLHAVVDDMNIEDYHLNLKHIPYQCDSEMQKAAEEICLDELKRCTLEERASALALIELRGYNGINYYDPIDGSLFDSNTEY